MSIREVTNPISAEINGVKRVLLSFSSYISSLIDIGYGTGSDKATATVLVLASIFLSIASGYTTYSGLTQYTYPLVAALITFGIQGLLFGVSWRLGKLYIAGEISPAMWSIWLVTMLVSVFFSYSSLFSTVYTENERKENRIIASISIGNSILTSLNEELTKEFSNKKLSIDTAKYSKWKNETVATILKARKFAEEELKRRDSQYKVLLEKYNTEIKYGGTKYVNSSGRSAITTAGPGKISDKYLKTAKEYKKYDLEPYREKSKNILLIRKNIFSNMAEFEKSKDIEFLSSSYKQCVDLVTMAGGTMFNCNPDLLGKSFRTLVEIKNRYKNFNKNCSVKVLNGLFSENIETLRECLSIAKVSKEMTEKYNNRISNFQRNEGPHTHFFITMLNELQRINYLAIGTFVLALLIDLLILLCSLVASKHNTFLSITSGKDLIQMKNYPLDIILGTDTSIRSDDNEMLRRIKLILNNAEFTLKYIDKKCSMTIPIEKILELKMHKELGTFFAMDLARPFDNGTVIGFRTNFILWMCEQISRKKQSKKSFSELNRAFAGEDNGEH